MRRFFILSSICSTLFYLTACGETIESELFPDIIVQNESEEVLTVAQWNIGHFSNGVSPNSKIEGNSFEQKRKDFTSLISAISADVFCINEYSDFWGTDKNSVKQKTDEGLFNNYSYSFIGHQSRYSCNAVFSMIPLNDSREIEYDSNQSAVITHTNAIKATDYYLIETDIVFMDKIIKLVSTHLAFDNNNENVAVNQIRELIDRYRNEEYIILCGDWNIKSLSAYDLFADEGYQLGNHGKFGDIITRDASKSCLDNIIVKGLNIVNFQAIKSKLSDHRPIIASLVLSN